MSDAVNVVAIHYPRPDKVQEFRELVLHVKNTFKHFAGYPSHHAFEVGTGEDVKIVDFERYKDNRSLDRVLASAEFQKISGRVESLVRQAPQIIQGSPLPGFEGSSQTDAVALCVDSQWV